MIKVDFYYIHVLKIKKELLQKQLLQKVVKVKKMMQMLKLKLILRLLT
jgi:hypothetical protein